MKFWEKKRIIVGASEVFSNFYYFLPEVGSHSRPVFATLMIIFIFLFKLLVLRLLPILVLT